MLWDVDGTLADSFDLALGATNEVLRGAGYDTVSAEGYAAATRYATPARFAVHATGDPEDASGVGAELGERFDQTYIALVSADTAGFYEGVPELLAAVRSRGVRQGVLSNAAGEYARAVVRANGFDDTFGVVLGADDVPAPKPAPDGLFAAAEALGVEPGRCAYVGDAPSDGRAARAAGMRALGVTWGSHGADALDGCFDALCDDVDALASALGVTARSLDS